MTKRPAAEGGFTLTELVIALSISTMVLVGLVAVATSIVRAHMDGIKRGGANATTLYALSQMNRELELATLFEDPPTSGGNLIRGCVNWSRYLPPSPNAVGGQIANDCSASLTSDRPCGYYFAYCVSGTSLYRHANNPGDGCPSPIPTPTCGSGGTAVVLNTFYANPDVGANRFFRVAGAGVRTAYQVGDHTPTEKTPQPIFYRIDTTIRGEKSLGVTLD